MGRPFGAPGEPDFQRRVVRAALDLLGRTDGPVLEDFPDPAPGLPADTEGWACPVDLARIAVPDGQSAELFAAIRAEIALLSPWYDEAARNNQGRHLDGLTGMAPEKSADYLARFVDNPDLPGPIEGEPLARGLKLVIDDLRYFYYQAAL
ncbi:MAG: hypothetical protein QGF09_13795, partial [Rhodospirillales bacterium]|nr:hypothetical protein [Rhodospirillales bacterium]